MAKVRPWIEDMKQSGGTIAAPAFEKALALKPRPDVIFFMTDGHLTGDDPSKVALLNKEEPAVVIHSILFRKTAKVAGPENLARQALERIAADGKGTFTQFIDPDALPAKKKKKA